MSNGWIKLHRKLLQWEWYEDTNTVRVFLHLLLNANHAQKKWQGVTIERGQLITSLDHIAKPLGLSVRQVRTALSKLESTKELTSQATNRYRLITLCSWDSYQIEDDGATSQESVKRQADDKQMTGKRQASDNKQECKELKNVKNDKNKIHFGTWPSIPSNDILRDWKKVRTTKKAAWTQIAVNGMAKELYKAQAAGMSVDDCLTVCIECSWTTFKYEWYLNLQRKKGSQNVEPESSVDRIMRLYGNESQEKEVKPC